VQAEVNLNLIDEAFYAVAGDVAKPLEKLYVKVGPGTLLTKKTHDSLMSANEAGAEKGGCFAAGTKILMADGSTKFIEDIERGDKIATFIDPLTRKLTSGKVMEIWHDTAVEFIVINDKIRVTPEHQIFASNRFIDAGLLRIGDWLLNPDGERVPIRSISIDHEVRPIYNLRIEPQNTFFADGIYVHNQEKGGGPREYFTDAALFKNVRTNSSGQVNLKFTLPDNITSWRVTAQAITLDLRAGTNVAKIPVSLPVFADVSIGKEYLLDDKPIAKLRAFGNALNKEDKVEFSVKAPDLGLEQSGAMLASAFEPAYFNLPAFKIGNYQIIYNLKTAKGNDAIKLPLAVISSRLEKQTVENQPLTIDTRIQAKNNLPIAIILSNQERSRLYNILQKLGWSWGDRIDQKYTRVLARKMLEEDFEQKILAPNFNSFDYQTQSGGITLLPYSSEDLELSARVSALNTNDFDQESLAQYFYKILNSKKSNQEEISLALFGLAELGKPVLARINSWLGRDDLSVKEKLYLALGLADLGAKEWARSIYYDILEQYGRSKEPHYVIKINDNLDDTFETTMIASALAASLGAEEAYGLLDYVQKNQRIYGLRKNSERLYNFEKLQYVSRTIPRTQGGSLKIVYEFDGKKNEVELHNNETHSFEINSSDIDRLKFLDIEGDAYVSVRYIEPLNLTEVLKDNDISIKREYYVVGHKVNEFLEKDTIEVRLYPSFKRSALSGYYQVTDILPSGLQPVSKISTRFDDRGCSYWYPYNTDGQKVKYKIHRDWKFSRCGGYIKYYARVVNTGKYKAEPAVLQSFDNPEYINFSQADEVIITK
ncbi:hypothetical protein K8R32_00730, partial [bacterium]|nr:hypothetical protein [bacterium]